MSFVFLTCSSREENNKHLYKLPNCSSIQQTRSFSKTKYIKNDFSERMVIKEIEIFNQNKIQEQPSRGVLRKRGSENMQQIYRRTFKSKCNLNNVAKQLY